MGLAAATSRGGVVAETACNATARYVDEIVEVARLPAEPARAAS